MATKRSAVLVLMRRDDPTQRVELVRWHVVLHGWWGYSRKMMTNRHRPALFLKYVWEIVPEK